jgi:hypothetical protein
MIIAFVDEDEGKAPRMYREEEGFGLISLFPLFF